MGKQLKMNCLAGGWNSELESGCVQVSVCGHIDLSGRLERGGMIVRHGGGFIQEDGMFAGNDGVRQY